jgi:hypothetical protein
VLPWLIFFLLLHVDVNHYGDDSKVDGSRGGDRRGLQ